MGTLKWLCLLGVVFAVLAAAQAPVISVSDGGVVNAASYASVGLLNSSIAQGAIIAIFGLGIGPVPYVQATTWPLPKSLGGVTVQITDSAGVSRPAILFFVYGGYTTLSPTGATLTVLGQINALLPSATALGAATATVTYNGQTSNAEPFTVVQSSFGAFALGTGGSGPGAVQNYVPTPPWLPNTIFSSATPGQTVILYGTGLGPVSGDETQPPTPVDLRSGLAPMTLWVGGQQVPIGYAGRSTSSGEDQINFVVPNNITGCYVPVALQIGNVVSNYVSIAIAPSGGTCADWTALNPATLQANGVVHEGSVTLAQATICTPAINYCNTAEAVGATFETVGLFPFVASAGSPPYGLCTVTSASLSGPAAPPVVVPYLDAGASLSLSGAGGSQTMKTPSANPIGNFYGSITSLPTGAYTVAGPGGKDVGSFSASLNVPAPIAGVPIGTSVMWIDRTQGFTVNWSGGSGDVFIIGTSEISLPHLAQAQFTCRAHASDGSFTVPPAILMALPVSVVSPANGRPLGVLQIINQPPPSTFTASGLDVGAFSVSYSFQGVAGYQ